MPLTNDFNSAINLNRLQKEKSQYKDQELLKIPDAVFAW